MTESPENWLLEAGYGEIIRSEAVGGGCINDARRLHLADGSTLLLKTNRDAPADMFGAEASGLAALSAAGALRIPGVIHCASNFIVLEDLGSGSKSPRFWADLGTGLAALHRQTAERFGFTGNNYCGATPQSNPPTADGYEFFAQQRILALAHQCLDRGLLQQELMTQLDYIAEHLPQWIPEMPAVLIHGDLWYGNIHCCANGEPALIDPAAYWGWAEAELAMTRLFGGFSPEFYDSYLQQGAVARDWEERIPLYNLYHLLNHLLLFGGSYLGAVAEIATRYAGRVR